MKDITQVEVRGLSNNNNPVTLSIKLKTTENLPKKGDKCRDWKPEVFNTTHNPHPEPETWKTLFSMRDDCAFAVFIQLSRHYNYRDGYTSVSRKTVSKHVGYNPSAVSRAYATLEHTVLPNGQKLIARLSGGKVRQGEDGKRLGEVIRWKVNGLVRQDIKKKNAMRPEGTIR